jgi:dipeptidyl aminopeptidase/acylaminoacyl peptidase
MTESPDTQQKPMAYGTWPSSLSAEQLAQGSIRFGEPRLLAETVYWPQSLPNETGRSTIMAMSLTAKKPQATSLLEAPWDVRSKVHEYGGGAYAVNDQELFFVNAADQQIYRFKLDRSQSPKAITAATQSRYADLVIHPSGQWLVAVCETHQDAPESQGAEVVANANAIASPVASIVAISLGDDDTQFTVASGNDFYAGITLSPNGKKLAFITWNHPDMPWDNSALWECNWQNGSPQNLQSIAGSITSSTDQQSLTQAQYSAFNSLYFVSDKSNWWNIYQAMDSTSGLDHTTEKSSVAAKITWQIAADCATPQWTFGARTWGFLDEKRILIAYTEDGKGFLAVYDIQKNTSTRLNCPYTFFSHMDCNNGSAVVICGGPGNPSAPALVCEIDGQWLIRPLTHISNPLAAADISQPKSYWFPTTRGEQAHLWFYPPTNALYKGEKNTFPPVIVIAHGGPTAAADTSLNLKIQFWTHRGFAVADVNYRGSSGFGRAYRQRLQNQWGLLDVEDLCAAANFLVEKNLVHPQQKIVKGSSAGGYSVLAALTRHKIFNAGVSHYGVADLTALAKDTHKFESRYLDGLIGQYPEQIQEYRERSPINHVDELNCPIFIAQGLDDKVVPPAQAELIVEAARKKQIPVIYLQFDGEGHGFRQAKTIVELFTAEYNFYRNIFRLENL